MKQKYIAAITAKFAGINVRKDRKAAIADWCIAKYGDDESKIDEALEAYNELMPVKDLASADDAFENKIKAQVPKPKSQDDPKDPPQDPPADPPKDDTPEWAKRLMEEVSQLRGEKVKNEIRNKISGQLKDVPEKFWSKRALPEKDEDIETFVTEVNTDFTEFHQGLVDKGLAIKPPKSGAAGGAPGKETASKEEIDAVAKQIIV
jgi:hypothetical protein